MARSVYIRMVLVLSSVLCLAGVSAQSPLESHTLVLDSPAMTWDEGLPLGNGLLGGLVWGDGGPLKISLDRTDLWDLRPVPQYDTPDYNYAAMREWVKQKRIEDLHRLYDDPYGNAGPTKIPAGRIEFTLGENLHFKKAELPLAPACARVSFDGAIQVRALIHAVEPIGMIEVSGISPKDVRVIAPPFSGEVKDPAAPNKISAGDLASLGYPAPMMIQEATAQGYTQQGWGDFHFAVYLEWQEVELPHDAGKKKPARSWRGVWSIATSSEGSDPLAVARMRVRKALLEDWMNLQASHLLAWLDYWKKSSIEIPDKVIEKQWYLDMYKFGSAAHRNHPPISLQGPWTADDGKLPPWKGDYHHDLNTELCYWPCYTGNHLDEGLGFLDWLWKTKPNCETWTRRFFGKPGLNVPMTADLNNNQIGGWHQYTHSSTTAAWLAHHFYLHWRYSTDEAFLKEQAYPYLRETAVFLEAITENGEDGQRTLPLSSSPEIHDNRLEAWFPSITNYDLALIRWTFAKTAELADRLGLESDASHWREVLAEMPEFALSDKTGGLLVAKNIPLQDSHRHLSHLMAIHPLGLITWENGEKDQKVILAALEEMDRLGTSQWCGYSFAWKASMAARARDGKRAAEALRIFAEAFCLRNSFHANGDQSGKGYSNLTYRPFTLEGNCAAAAGLQEMLLQSYSGEIRIFPAIPDDWKEASFDSLRAEGAFLVSAQRAMGQTQRVEIQSEKGGACHLENPFPDGGFEVVEGKSEKVSANDSLILIELLPGEKVALTWRKKI